MTRKDIATMRVQCQTLADRLETTHLEKTERAESGALYDLNQLLEWGEFGRVVKIIREVSEKLPRKAA